MSFDRPVVVVSGTVRVVDATDGRCNVVVVVARKDVACDLPAGHEGPHSGHIAGVEGPSRDELIAGYSTIPADFCIFCPVEQVETAVVFVQPAGVRVAVPGRVGLCATCHGLVRGGAIDAVPERTRGTDWEDFPDEDVLPLIRALAGAYPQ
jgi:hypothetical protein